MEKQGWKRESERHALASKGISTKEIMTQLVESKNIWNGSSNLKDLIYRLVVRGDKDGNSLTKNVFVNTPYSHRRKVYNMAYDMGLIESLPEKKHKVESSPGSGYFLQDNPEYTHIFRPTQKAVAMVYSEKPSPDAVMSSNGRWMTPEEFKKREREEYNSYGYKSNFKQIDPVYKLGGESV